MASIRYFFQMDRIEIIEIDEDVVTLTGNTSSRYAGLICKRELNFFLQENLLLAVCRSTLNHCFFTKFKDVIIIKLRNDTGRALSDFFRS